MRYLPKSPQYFKCKHTRNRNLSKCGKEEDLNNCQKDLSYVPGDLTDQNQLHHTYNQLSKNQANNLSANELYTEKHNNCTDELAHLQAEDSHRIRNKNQEHILKDFKIINDTDEKMPYGVTEKPGQINTIPLIPASCNFQSAKKMAQENLEHQPLPDSIVDNAYRRWQAQGVSNPELALDVTPSATGVGVRTHNAGPNHCTKLKVYRPKTCGMLARSTENINLHLRPLTASISKTNLGPMDLAICWDYRTADPRDEPKPSTHIDGSNGSAAPAVFTLVKTPKTPADNEPTGRSAGVFSNTLGEESFFDKDIMHRKKNYFTTLLKEKSDSQCKCRNSAPASLAHNTNKAQCRSNSSPNLSVIAQASSQSNQPDKVLVCNYSKEHYHYRPVSHHSHYQHHHPHRHAQNAELNRKNSQVKEYLCGNNKPARINRLCDQNSNLQIPNTRIDIHKTKQKNPFRAGIPNSNASGTCTSFDSGCSSTSTASEFTSKTVKIPKPRDPYAKKNYVIDTLAPPFSCWKGGAGQGGYPEHWRLSSVYQQAYKPVEQRKRPLLATVFQ